MRYHERSVSNQGFASLSDFAVLEVLLHMGALPVNAIGERVLLTSGSITTAVQRLEKKGLLQRERSRLDARVVLVRLTSAGQDLIESNSSQHADNLEDLFVEFSEEERSQFEKLITKFDKRVRHYDTTFVRNKGFTKSLKRQFIDHYKERNIAVVV